jgi:hypothetical protein
VTSPTKRFFNFGLRRKNATMLAGWTGLGMAGGEVPEFDPTNGNRSGSQLF